MNAEEIRKAKEAISVCDNKQVVLILHEIAAQLADLNAQLNFVIAANGRIQVEAQTY